MSSHSHYRKSGDEEAKPQQKMDHTAKCQFLSTRVKPLIGFVVIWKTALKSEQFLDSSRAIGALLGIGRNFHSSFFSN
jgi:hypothetical protein